MDAQEEAAREADKAARKAIREQKKRERKEDFQTRVDELKAKFHKVARSSDPSLSGRWSCHVDHGAFGQKGLNPHTANAALPWR